MKLKKLKVNFHFLISDHFLVTDLGLEAVFFEDFLVTFFFPTDLTAAALFFFIFLLSPNIVLAAA